MKKRLILKRIKQRFDRPQLFWRIPFPVAKKVYENYYGKRAKRKGHLLFPMVIIPKVKTIKNEDVSVIDWNKYDKFDKCEIEYHNFIFNP